MGIGYEHVLTYKVYLLTSLSMLPSLNCTSGGVNRWMMSMISDRNINVELQEKKKVIAIK